MRTWNVAKSMQERRLKVRVLRRTVVQGAVLLGAISLGAAALAIAALVLAYDGHDIATAFRKELEREYRRGFIAGIRYEKERFSGQSR